MRADSPSSKNSHAPDGEASAPEGLGRRTFLKLAAAAGSALSVGALLGEGRSEAGHLSLSMDAWRARPGTPLPIVLEDNTPGGPVLTRARLDVVLVEVDPQGVGQRVLASARLTSRRPGRWEGSAAAPALTGPRRESYLLAAAFVDDHGGLARSAPVEVVCAPIHASF